jgi:hypothetical protein
VSTDRRPAGAVAAETLIVALVAAVRAAREDQLQTSINPALGSGMVHLSCWRSGCS